MALVDETVNDKWIGTVPPTKARGSAQNTQRDAGRVRYGTKDLLCDSRRPNPDEVAHIFEVGVASFVRNTSLNTIINERG